jgi:DNA-binding HxlR family transcriptional regulator
MRPAGSPTLSRVAVTTGVPAIVRPVREPLPADMFEELCPSSLNPIRFGDKWAALIIRCLEPGPRRFSELRVPLRRVSPKVLTQSLRSLERDGLVKRTVYAEATRMSSTS